MVARSTWDGAVTVYRYGCPSWVDLDAVALDQIHLAHTLRNELVAMEHRYAQAVEATWALHPEIAAADDAVTAAQTALDTVRETAKAERAKDRTTVPRAATRATLAAARSALRDAKALRREAKDRWYPVVKSELIGVRRARDAARKALYADWVQTRGLYWATYNDVVARHETAVKQVNDQRKQGRPAELRFHRWDGTGTLTVQLQRQLGDPPRTPELLASGDGKWRNVCQLAPWAPPEEWNPRRGPHRHGICMITTGNKDRIRIPIIVHRTLPAEADITLVRITRRRIAGRYRLSVTVTARIPAPDPAVGALVAVHLGWRSLGDDGIRVAVVTADRPLAGPPLTLPVHRVGHGWEIRLPARMRDAHQTVDDVRSTRDKALDIVRGDVAEWLDRYQPDDEPSGVEVRRWRSPARFAALAQRWRQEPPPEGADMACRLEAWRRQDRHLWEWEANARDQHAARVRDLWANLAAWLCGQAGMVVVDDTPIRDLVRVPDVGTEDSAQARAARRQQHTAAPGELRAAISRAAVARGVTFAKAPAKGITTVHCGCGATLTGDPAAQISLWCSTCGCGVDQDLNAAEWLLAVANAPEATG